SVATSRPWHCSGSPSCSRPTPTSNWWPPPSWIAGVLRYIVGASEAVGEEGDSGERLLGGIVPRVASRYRGMRPGQLSAGTDGGQIGGGEAKQRGRSEPFGHVANGGIGLHHHRELEFGIVVGVEAVV